MHRHPDRMTVAAVLCAVGFAVGCRDAEPPQPVGEAPAVQAVKPTTQAVDPDEVDRLRALGYVGFSDETVDPDEAAVPFFDAARSVPGYNLVISRDLCLAQLFDAEGRPVHEWRDSGVCDWGNAELLENGDLLVPGSRRAHPPKRNKNFLLRMSRDGEVVWRAEIDAHHDVELTPSGRVATLDYSYRRIPEISAELDVRDNDLVLLSAEGEVLESYSLYDLLRQNPGQFSFQEVGPRRRRSSEYIDLLHANSVEWMRHPHLEARAAIYAPSNVLVSFRHQDTLAIFDWEKKTLLWAWGQGEISGPHAPSVLENGNILVFDNGLGHKRSRVVELDPLRREIVWQYRAPDPEDFFTVRMGSSQLLPGGNVLIADSDHGEAFEVTREGEVVWRFRNPNAHKNGKRAVIVSIRRYPRAFVEGWLGRP